MDKNKVINEFRKIENGRKVEFFSFWMQLFDNLYFESNLPSSETLNLLKWDLSGTSSRIRLNNSRISAFFLKNITRLFFYFYTLKNNSIVFLPGPVRTNKRFFDRLCNFFCRIYLDSLNLSVNQGIKSNFFLNLKKSNKIPNNYIESLELVLPDIFFCDYIDVGNFPKTFFGSTVSLLEFPWVYLIFFKNIKINAIAHGGFYDELKNNNLQKFEKKISDKYIGWGLSEYNIVQNRFNFKKSKKCNINSITIVGVKDKISQNTKWMFPGYEHIVAEADRFYSNFNKCFPNDLTIFYRPSKYLTFANDSYNNYKINNELNGTIFIFNKPFSTFFYKCVYWNLPFVLYFSEDWIKFFTDNYVDFLLFLKSNNLLYFWGEEEKMNAFLDSLLNNPNSNLNSNLKVIEYLKSKNNFNF